MRFDDQYFGDAESTRTGCDWPGCEESGDHRAPKDRNHLTDYYWFCLKHAREYNTSWNFFEGMQEDEFESLQWSTATWERPTWPVGKNPRLTAAGQAWRIRQAGNEFRDGLNLSAQRLDGLGGAYGEPVLSREDHSALKILGLDRTATLHDVKKRYKQLVKRYHPDANTGAEGTASRGRQAQERLRAVIQAYSHLVKSSHLANST